MGPGLRQEGARMMVSSRTGYLGNSRLSLIGLPFPDRGARRREGDEDGGGDTNRAVAGDRHGRAAEESADGTRQRRAGVEQAERLTLLAGGELRCECGAADPQ